jgi:hypothetical protein
MDDAAAAAQAAAIERYRAAASRHDQRLARQEATLVQRAEVAAARRAARREAAAAAAAEEHLALHGRFADLSAEHGCAGAAGAPPPERPAKQLTPSLRTQHGLLAAALSRGLDYGPGVGRGLHDPSCGCAACTATRAAVRSQLQKAGESESAVASAVQLCAQGCSCTRCAWLRWRTVNIAQRSESAAALLRVAQIKRGRPRTAAKHWGPTGLLVTTGETASGGQPAAEE